MNDIEILEEILNRPIEDTKGTIIMKQAIENLINRVKELEEYKRITELTKISCCTAQNCEALNNGIRQGLENNKLKERILELETIEAEHQKINGELQEKIKELEKENKKYPIKMTDEQYKKVIDLAQKDIKEELDRQIKAREIEEKYVEENFMTREEVKEGLVKQNELLKKYYIPKSKIKEKLEEYEGLKEIDIWAYEEQIKPLKELLEEENE